MRAATELVVERESACAASSANCVISQKESGQPTHNLDVAEPDQNKVLH
jgi:hypothetical protein